MPKTGFEPIINSYKGSVLPIKTIPALNFLCPEMKSNHFLAFFRGTL